MGLNIGCFVHEIFDKFKKMYSIIQAKLKCSYNQYLVRH